MMTQIRIPPVVLLITLLSGSAVQSVVLAQCAQEEQQLLAAEGAYGDEFGFAVEVAGNVAVAGAWKHDAAANLSGAAYILRRDDNGWAEEQKLAPDDGQLADFFGWSVAIDVDTAAIGSVGDGDGAPDGGSVYVYQFNGVSWDLEVELFASDAGQGDQFGNSVALDGDTLLVGAHKNNDHATWSGSAYVFRRVNGRWVETDELHSWQPAYSEHFGYSVDLDGDLAVIGAYGASNFKGAAYVFRWDGVSWQEEERLVGSQTVGGDFFAASVAVSGPRVVCGARWADIGNIVDTGEAYVFRNDAGAWVEEQRLTEEDPDGGDGFAFSVDISGGLVLIGAHNAEPVGPHSGEAVLFRLEDGVWIHEPRLIPADSKANDFFGLSVSIDGGHAVIGAPWDDDQAEDGGAVYAYDVSACLPTSPADLDGDGDVDLSDFLSFFGCITGPATHAMSGCEAADFDGDTDVDLVDFAFLERAFGGG